MQFLLLAAVANTSAGPRNVQRKNDKSVDLLANRRHRIIRPVSAGDDKEANGGETRAELCVQDYSPCSCSLDSNQISVSCLGISVETVRDVFLRVNDPEIYQLEFSPPADDTNTFSLSTDFLGNTSVSGAIYIYGGNYPKLVIDPLAFRSSQNSLTFFSVENFDFGLQKDFSFLNGFNRLESLSISYIINFTAFQYLPSLPSLQELTVGYCPELNQIAFPDLSSAKLNYLDLNGNEMIDEKADEIFAELATSNSSDSLEYLDLWSNSLTEFPSQVGSAFPKLKSLNLNNNKISHILSASFTFVSPYLEDLYLGFNELKTIESGGFRGKLTSARAINIFFCVKN